MGLKGFRPGDRTVYVLLGFLASLILLAAYWYQPGFLTVMNLKATDAMFAARSTVKPAGDVVIVAVDEKSVNELGRWPWTRTKTASLVRALGGARTVALDIVFSEPESAAADSALAGAIEEAGNVTLGFFFRNDSTEEPGEGSLEALKRSKVNFLTFSDDEESEFEPVVPAPAFDSVETNTEIVGRAAAGFGAFNVFPYEDGVYRDANLAFVYDNSIYPSIALEALRQYLETDVVVSLRSYGIDTLELDEHIVPVDETGALSLNFYGAGSTFTTYPAVDVIKGKVSADLLKDKLVFVGVTERAVYDIRPTPLDPLFPGVEIHATAAANVLEGRYLIHDTRVILLDLLVVLFAPFALSIAVSFAHRTFTSLIIFALMLVVLVAGYFGLFTVYDLRVGVIYPVLALGLSYLFGEAYRNAVVEKKGRYLKKAFSTYVSPQLVTQIIKDPDSLKLGGEKRNVTVLFSDIRGFTSLSERLTPEDLVALLNEYLSPMTRIVLEEEGMLDKYIGDAIMAIFNAPVTVKDHPARACAAALEMMKKLVELNEEWGRRDLPLLDIGIGVNTGEAVVGNMGAELKFDYTGIGDTVNLASRLEGLNKLYGTHIIVSGQTRDVIRDQFDFRELDLVRVKGKETPVVLYELLGRAGDPGPPGPVGGLRARFEEGLALFRSMKFEAARDVFTAILAEYPEDSVSALYVTRCDEYTAEPPPGGWDGVYVAKTK